MNGLHNTYKGCHVDIDTSCEEVMDLPHQAIITSVLQFYFLKDGTQGEAWSRKERAHKQLNRVQSTWSAHNLEQHLRRTHAVR